MDYSQYTVESIKKGYVAVESKGYQCLICGEYFDQEEVFPVDGRFYTAEKAAKYHLQTVHGNRLDSLLGLDKKLTSLTDNQKEIISLMATGISDKEIAKKLSLSPSTIRHLRFTMKEKAKQAKVFLALYDLAFDKEDKTSDLVTIHDHATMVDDRYHITESEQARVIDRFFTSLSPLKLKTFSTKEKNKIVILRTIAAWLDSSRSYSEKELNDSLKTVYDDFATIRRYLIEYGFMERSKDGSLYRIKG